MEIKHHITFTESKSQRLLEVIEDHKIKYKRVPGISLGSSLIVFDIYESHNAWNEILVIVQRNQLPDLPQNVFSKKELQSASWYRLLLINPVGYPQPENKWLETQFTYLGYDPQTGFYSDQVKNFVVKNEPKLKKRHFMTLYWTHELFAIKEVINKFKEHGVVGYEPWDVILQDTNKPSDLISQIVVLKKTEAHMLLENHPYTTTNSDSVKYLPIKSGMLKYSEELLEESADIVHTKEWFGDRHAYREILVSKKVADLIMNNNWKGVKIEPIQIMTN